MKQWKKVLLIVTVPLVALLWYNSLALAQNVLVGVDLWETRPGDAIFNFGGGFECPPLPADFFEPGSDPFEGQVAFQGQPLQTIPSGILGSADTIVKRRGDATLPSCPSSDTIPIEIVALDLVSTAPITVTNSGGGGAPSQWDVRMCLSSETSQPIGSKTIDKDCDEGGTFTTVIPIIPKFIFTRVDPPHEQMIWDYGLSGDVIVYGVLDGYWLYDDPGFNVITSPGGVLVDHDCNGASDVAVGPGSNFYPGLQAVPCDCQSDPADYNMVLTLWQSQGCGDHGVYPPQAEPQPTIEPQIATECPEIPTECPAVETVCPEWGDTYCPVAETLCPKVETLCPFEETFCPEFDPTFCPYIDTECFQYPTWCPIDTFCPDAPTFCYPFPTICEVLTSCPSDPTFCPLGQFIPTICPMELTVCPDIPTSCFPEIPTECPVFETFCPGDWTYCPINYTWCPGDIPTECPMDWTNCPVIPTVCPESFTVCPEVITECPQEPTQCFPDPTICEITVCPEDPTFCPLIDTDGDGIIDCNDNCPNHPNGPSQGTCTRTVGPNLIVSTGQFCTVDADCDPGEFCEKVQADNYPPGGNGIGDACDCEANFDCDQDVDANDVTAFLFDFGRSIFFNPCTNASPCNGDLLCDVDVDADDVAKFLEDFGRSTYFLPCPICSGAPWCSYP